ncbi:MAG: protein kinase domain-containing protein [Planctomycetaceae bacterium]
MSRVDDSRTSLDPVSEVQVFGEPLDDPRVLEVVQEYLAELERGRSPSREKYLARYPELTQAVRDCLDGLELVRGGLSNSQGKSISGSLPGPRASERPPKSLGDFLIVREIARGGMGVVYEAVQQSLGRRVALKVLPFAATFDSRQLQRFKNEAQAAALLHHTHIVPIYAVGSDRGVHFYAMQLIEGQSLAAVIRQMREQAGLVREKSPPPPPISCWESIPDRPNRRSPPGSSGGRMPQSTRSRPTSVIGRSSRAPRHSKSSRPRR